MSFWVDLVGHKNIRINSELIPRIGELIVLGPDTFPGQETELKFRVTDVVYHIEGYLSLETGPTVILEPGNL